MLRKGPNVEQIRAGAAQYQYRERTDKRARAARLITASKCAAERIDNSPKKNA